MTFGRSFYTVLSKGIFQSFAYLTVILGVVSRNPELSIVLSGSLPLHCGWSPHNSLNSSVASVMLWFLLLFQVFTLLWMGSWISASNGTQFLLFKEFRINISEIDFHILGLFYCSPREYLAAPCKLSTHDVLTLEKSGCLSNLKRNFRGQSDNTLCRVFVLHVANLNSIPSTHMTP